MNLKFLFSFLAIFLLLSSMAFGQRRSNSRHCFKGFNVMIKGGDTTLVQAKNRLRGQNIVRLSTRPLVVRYGYVVVDSEHVVEQVLRTNFVDVNKLEPGHHYIYSFSYLGKMVARKGDNIMEEELASYCSQLSDNRVHIEIIE